VRARITGSAWTQAACETRSAGAHARKATRHRRRVPRAERGVARSIVPLDVKAGDRILCGNSGAEITVDGEEDLIMREEDVLGIVEA
jgi:Chaperonin 10 Kd subunit